MSLVNAIIITIAILIISYLRSYRISVDLALLSLFVSFIGSFMVIYFYYYMIINKRIHSLSERIRETFLSKELPLKQNMLEEVDSITQLHDRVNMLIEKREKETSQFENLDSYRKEYLGNVSHELKTPIFNIQGYIDTLIHGGVNDPEINIDYLKRAEKSVDRLINIIDDLETITQLESGDMHLEMEKFDIAALCKDIYLQLELNASKRNISMLLSKKYDKPIFVVADKFRIRQVLVNLITNGIKYGLENGMISINISNYENDVIVEITDDGVGIEEKHLPRLFERFYRIDKGRSREQGGTGLGLAIVKHILEAHHKSIAVESQLGKGTKFTFSLKAAE
ncbi:MAG: sensor histidine kinase [Bacteroidia bacterium]|nr:sensor histidine kinase [Sphingobacteriaceae bacterium]MBK7818601.1 sensor histidine kinase [Sphingobacteriaceae bacterium]MBP9068490.1 sensor histidine kinase [Bacteroidia bacterium]